MSGSLEKYQDALNEAFGHGTVNVRIKAFRKAMMIRSEMAARDIGRCLDNTPLIQSLGGQTTAFFELADWAGQALEAEDAKAKAEAAERIPGLQR